MPGADDRSGGPARGTSAVADRDDASEKTLTAVKEDAADLRELASADQLGGYVVVGAYPDAIIANLALAKLTSVGIRGRLRDEETVSIDPLLASVVGGVKVVTLAADAEDARGILDGLEAEEDDHEGDALEPRCPECDSPYLRNVRGKVRCQRCGYKSTIDVVTRRAPYRAAGRRKGDPVFRLVRRHTGLGVFTGLVAGGLVAMLLPRYVSETSRWFVFGVCLAVGVFAGWVTRTETCSRPKCRAKLPAGAATCPACKGHVEGEITRPQDHHVRRAAWLKGEAALPRK